MRIKLIYFIWIMMILGIIAPFIAYAVIIQFFFLLIPFATILFVSIVNFIFNLIEYKKEIFKKNQQFYFHCFPFF